MAEFCKQCVEDVLGLPGDKNDFVGIQTEETTKAGLFSVVICEGCGFIQVDHTGRCVSTDCLRNHNKGPEETAPVLEPA